jgi:hypothetical protein
LGRTAGAVKGRIEATIQTLRRRWVSASNLADPAMPPSRVTRFGCITFPVSTGFRPLGSSPLESPCEGFPRHDAIW